MLPIRAIGIVILGVGLAAVALPAGSRAGEAKPLLPPEIFEILIKQDAKFIQDALAMPALDKKLSRKVRGAAFLIAVAAQTVGKDAKNEQEMATLRDRAFQVIKAVEDNKLDDAKRLAAELGSRPKADPAVKSGPVAFDKALDLENVMHVFASERVGGFGIEKELGDFAESKDALTAPQLEKLVLHAYRIGLIGLASDSYAKEKDEGGMKTAKNWLTFSEQLRKQAFGLAEAARTNQQANVRKGLEGLTASCVKCHDVFR